MNQPINLPVRPVRAKLTNDSLVCVSMESEGVTFLRAQLELDITAKGLGWQPIPFTLFELIEIQRLLPDEIVNAVITHGQRKLIAHYCTLYHALAKNSEDTERENYYDEFLTALLEGCTLITFQL
ncbi:hypothetical protein [Spirosoma litoris]